MQHTPTPVSATRSKSNSQVPRRPESSKRSPTTPDPSTNPNASALSCCGFTTDGSSTASLRVCSSRDPTRQRQRRWGFDCWRMLSDDVHDEVPSMSASSEAGIPTPDGVHRRRNPLTGEWILVSAGRDKRPWQGQVEPARRVELPSHDPDCHLCPGNERAGGQTNPDYDTTFVFTNDFAALRPDPPSAPILVDDPLFNARTQRGTCRVICFSPRHDLSLADMSSAEARRVVDLWVDQSAELNEQWQWVQIFENRGAAMGASSPHPHGQIWASAEIPSVVETEAARQRQYFASEGGNLLGEYAARELASGD